jgi:hypothetical protein
MDKVIRDWFQVNEHLVHVGIVKPEIKRKNNRTVQMAVVARAMEKGNKKKNVPARPTIVPAVKGAKYAPRVKNLAINIAVGNGIIGLQKIGEVAALKAKSNIQGIKQPPLKPATIARRINKGTTNPLVDTRQLLRSIRFAVKKKGVDV